jgi:alkylhydroperoxidase family enzyme
MSAERPQPMLPLLTAEQAVAAALAAGIPEILAAPNVFRLGLRHPKVAQLLADVIDLAVLNGTLDGRLREVAILRVGWRIGSVYEWSNHVPLGRRFGLTDADLVAIRSADSSVLTPTELLVIKVVDEVLDRIAVTPATLDAIRAELADDNALMELVTIAGCYRLIGSLLLTFRVPLEDHIPAWPPDGVASTASSDAAGDTE